MSGDYQSGINYAKGQINSETQPNAKFWSNWINAGSGSSMELNMHQGETRDGYYNLLFMNHPGQTTASGWVGANDIDALWIPPNWQMRADSCGNTNHCNSNERVANYEGTGGNTGFPGLYWPIPSLMNDIDTIHLTQKQDLDETDPDGTGTVPYTWDRFKQKCCAGAIDANNCGIYAPNKTGSVCNNVYKNCKGMDLKVPYGSNPSYRSQYCSAMASTNTTVGDTIKRQFCISNPADPFCSCMNLTNQPEYIRWTQAMNAKHPEIVISPLMYMDITGANPCRTHLTTDMQTQFIPSELIAQIGHLPTSYSIADITVSGDNNILTDINISGKPVTPPSRQSSDSSANDDKNANAAETAYTNYIIIAFIIIVSAVCAYSFIDDEPQPQYYYTNTQRPMMQPMMQQYQTV